MSSLKPCSQSRRANQWSVEQILGTFCSFSLDLIRSPAGNREQLSRVLLAPTSMRLSTPVNTAVAA